MSSPSRDEIIKRLVREFGYADWHAPRVADDIASFALPIAEAFSRWWQTGELPTMDVEGYTAARLAAEWHLQPVAVFLTLDWLLRDPEQAVAALRRGYDHVEF